MLHSSALSSPKVEVLLNHPSIHRVPSLRLCVVADPNISKLIMEEAARVRKESGETDFPLAAKSSLMRPEVAAGFAPVNLEQQLNIPLPLRVLLIFAIFRELLGVGESRN